jgi:lysozyme
VNRARLIAQLRVHEGVRRSAYQDSLGYWTIGVGRCIDKRLGCGLSNQEIDMLLANDINTRAAELAKALPWFTQLDDARQNVLINMSFMGVAKLLKFTKTLAHVRAQEWDAAAAAMLDSTWATQVGHRAHELAAQMQTGLFA